MGFKAALSTLLRFEFGEWAPLIFGETDLQDLDLEDHEREAIKVLGNQPWYNARDGIQRAMNLLGGPLLWPEESQRYYWPAMLDLALADGAEGLGLDWFHTMCEDLPMRPTTALYGRGLYQLSRFQYLLSTIVIDSIDRWAEGLTPLRPVRTVLLAKMASLDEPLTPARPLNEGPEAKAVRQAWAALVMALLDEHATDATVQFAQLLAQLVLKSDASEAIAEDDIGLIWACSDPSADEWRQIRTDLDQGDLLLCYGAMLSVSEAVSAFADPAWDGMKVCALAHALTCEAHDS